MTPDSALSDFLNELGRQVEGDLRTDTYSRILYSTDASIYRLMPHGVLIPQTVDDVQAAVELAARYRIALLPRGGGSSLAGQACNQALVIDMSRHLDQLLEVNTEEGWARVQPGIVLDDLNLRLKPHGLQFGPDPASSNRATMGGIVGNNSTGSHSIVYGMTADHVLETEVILIDGSRARFAPLDAAQAEQACRRPGLEGSIYRGLAELTSDEGNREIIRRGTPRHWRRCGGYNLDRLTMEGVSFLRPQDPRLNLARMMCGSEGTLAVMTEIKLNLAPCPAHTALAVVHFDSLYGALQAVPVILESDPTAVELMDHLGLTMCREVPEYARLLSRFVEGEPNCILITEFSGEDEAQLRERVRQLERRLRQQKVGCTAVVPALSPELQADVWSVRKVGLGLLMSIKGDHKPIPFIEDAAVPVEHLAEYVKRVEDFCSDLGTRVAYYAHASAGCLHIRPLVNTKLASEIAKLPRIVDFSVDLLGGYGGALSSEHGDGRTRSWANERFFGPELYGLYRQVKDLFDPQRILNPGMVVDAPPMTENLRYGPSYSVIPIRENLDWSEDQGFHRAVEMCNGAGVCRKLTTGVMCPSFMATREEEHSTRGRANALRAALSGILPAAELTGRRMHEVLDLCIECKACKAECPSSVDMAKIKLEFLAHCHDEHGVPLRSRLFAAIPEISARVAGPLAPLVNALMGSGPARAAMAKWLGISPHRALPGFARHTFLDWFADRKRNAPPHPGTHRQVAFFNDTWNTYNDPHISIAAVEVLQAAGLEVLLPGHRCCGRPAISKGLLEQARAAARETVTALAPYAERGLPIVGLEPSCILSLRDEYLSLLPGDPRARLVAEHALTFEEFVANLAEQGELPLQFTTEARPVLLHGHCHQRALVGTGPSKRILSLPSGYTVTEIDSSCCGMAGSFGYEAEHHDISLAMAERRLRPAVQEAGEDTIIVAAGTSCRHQILDGCGRRALHPAEVLRDALQREA